MRCARCSACNQEFTFMPPQTKVIIEREYHFLSFYFCAPGIWYHPCEGMLQRLSAALHGTLGSFLRDAFQEGSADAVAHLPFPHRA
jgi:hypothetical protein